LHSAAEGVVPEPEPRAFLETVAPDGAHFRVSFVTKGISSVQATRSVVLEKALRALEVAGVPTDASPPRAFDRVRLVHEQPLFRELTVDECAAMASRARMREEPAGTALCSEGEDGSSMFLVAEGLLDVHIGDRGRVGFLGAGDCFGEMSLLSGNPRSATVRAHTAVVLLEIDRDAILPLLDARPVVAEGFAKLLAARNKERAAFLASAGAAPREAESLVNELAARFLAYFGR
jgi:CRP-like cAMP-binding protein